MFNDFQLQKRKNKNKKLKDKLKKEKILGILARIYSLFLANISTFLYIFPNSIPTKHLVVVDVIFPVHLARSALFLHTILIQTIYM